MSHRSATSLPNSQRGPFRRLTNTHTNGTYTRFDPCTNNGLWLSRSMCARRKMCGCKHISQIVQDLVNRIGIDFFFKFTSHLF